jgi:MinD-like ATPase involved in chromosome partitioning or flagellar assembly
VTEVEQGGPELPEQRPTALVGLPELPAGTESETGSASASTHPVPAAPPAPLAEAPNPWLPAEPPEGAAEARTVPAPDGDTGSASDQRPPEDDLAEASPLDGVRDEPAPVHLDPRVAGLVRPGRTRPAPAPLRSVGSAVGAFVRPSSAESFDVDQLATQQLLARLPGPRRISVVALKGGVGKTTLSVLLAGTIARARREPVLLFDTDPTFGSLVLRTGARPRIAVADVARLGDPGSLERMRPFLAPSPDGVWVLPSGLDPEQSAALDADSYAGAMDAVHRHFPVMVTDCGTGLVGPVSQRVLRGSHTLVFATSPSLDGVMATHNSLSWLHEHGRAWLARNSTVVLTNVPRRGAALDLDETRQRFAPLCREVTVLPADPHLAAGGPVDLDALAPATRTAALRLAASVIGAALTLR